MITKNHTSYKNSIVNLAASLMKNYNIASDYESQPIIDYVLSKKYKHIAVILLDGMGMKMIDDNLGLGSIFKTNQIIKMNSVFPPTTVAATTALLSGKAPIESGWLGWDLYFGKNDPSVELFTNKEYYTENKFTKYNVKDIIGFTPWMSSIKRAKYYQLYPSNIVEGGYKSFDDEINRLEEICKLEESNFTYVYWADPDATAHEYGTKTLTLKIRLEELEQRIIKLNENLPNETCIFITADHGLIDIENIYLNEYIDFYNMLSKKISGESRFTQFYVKNEFKDSFKEEFNKLFGDKFILYTKEELLDSKLCGKFTPHESIKTTLGDFCAISTSNYAFFDAKKDLEFVAHHAGLTTEEMEIPVILLKRKDEKEIVEE